MALALECDVAAGERLAVLFHCPVEDVGSSPSASRRSLAPGLRNE